MQFKPMKAMKTNNEQQLKTMNANEQSMNKQCNTIANMWENENENMFKYFLCRVVVVVACSSVD